MNNKEIYQSFLDNEKLLEDMLADAQCEKQREKEPDAPPENLQLFELARARLKLFRSPANEAYATVLHRKSPRTLPLHSREFERWLARLFFIKQGRLPSVAATRECLRQLEGHALHGGRQRVVWVRVGEHKESLLIDLGGNRPTAVQLRAEGWTIVEQPLVPFWRPPGLMKLPKPEAGGSLNELREFVNVSDADWPLLVAWLLSALRPRGPFPILSLAGPPGAAKSTTALMLRSLVDPHSAPLQAAPATQRELLAGANGGWCVVLDNLARMPAWLSDSLCRLASGAGYSDRRLFGDCTQTLFQPKRPILLTGLEHVGTRTDLVDRSLRVTLPGIDEASRRFEVELWSAFEQARPRILGALYDAACAGLAHHGQTELDRLPRMADFFRWATAAERGCPWPAGTIVGRYLAQRAAATSGQASPLIAALLAWVTQEFSSECSVWSGTASELLQLLTMRLPMDRGLPTRWPPNASELSYELRKALVALRNVGLNVEFHRAGDVARTRQITLHWTGLDGFATNPSNRKWLLQNELDGMDGLDGKTAPGTVQSVRTIHPVFPIEPRTTELP